MRMSGRTGRATMATTLLTGVTVLALAACGEAVNTSGGTDGTVTLWTHNAGNPAELASVNRIVSAFNASQSQYKVKVNAFPQ